MTNHTHTPDEHLTDILVDLAAEGERWLSVIDETPSVEASPAKLLAGMADYVLARAEYEGAEVGDVLRDMLRQTS